MELKNVLLSSDAAQQASVFVTFSHFFGIIDTSV